MTLRLHYSAHSETGPVRKNNQDSCYASPSMLIVADGMGGAAAGDLASAVVIKELRAVDCGHADEDMLTALAGAVDRATDAIADLIETDPDLDGMGSTATGVAFDGERLGVVNIGDSRTYVFRDGVLTRLTHDHSWVQSLVDEGRISEEDSLLHPHRSLILRVINGQPQHVPDLHLEEVREGDRLLICSDGLCGLVTDAAIERNIDGPRAEVMKNLVEIAYEQGGLDNITIILADVADVPADDPLPDAIVLGAAERLDLDAPLDTLSISLPEEEADEEEPPPTRRADPAAPERARYAPTSRRHAGTFVKVIVSIVVALVLIGVGGWAGYNYTQQQYYIGAVGEPPNDEVALFRGVNDPVFHLPLSSVVQTNHTRVGDLPAAFRSDVRATIPMASYDAGTSSLVKYQEAARACIALRQAPPVTTPPVTTPPVTTPPASASPSVPTASPTASGLESPVVVPSTSVATVPGDPEDCG